MNTYQLWYLKSVFGAFINISQNITPSISKFLNKFIHPDYKSPLEEKNIVPKYKLLGALMIVENDTNSCCG
jgi:hypothetical protein